MPPKNSHQGDVDIRWLGGPYTHPQPQEMLQLPDECSYQQNCTGAETVSQHNMRDFIVMNLSAAVTRSHWSHLMDFGCVGMILDGFILYSWLHGDVTTSSGFFGSWMPIRHHKTPYSLMVIGRWPWIPDRCWISNHLVDHSDCGFEPDHLASTFMMSL